MSHDADLLVYGATGFTGAYVFRYLVEHRAEISRVLGRALKLAVAGRSEAKLKDLVAKTKVPADFAGNVKVLVADVHEPSRLAELAGQAKVLINCVGPFRYYGEQVVRACIIAGTSYVDVTGEPEFIEKMAYHHHAEGVSRQVTVVTGCGFDSIPAEMGVTFTKRQYPAPQVPSTIEMLFKLNAGPSGLGIHYATYESAVQGFGSAGELTALRRKASRPSIPKVGPALKLKAGAGWNARFNTFTVPFFFADPSVVRLSQQIVLGGHVGTHRAQIFRPVQFAAYISLPSRTFLFMMALAGAMFAFLAKFSLGRKLLLRFPKFFSFGLASHEGPTEQMLKETSFTSTFFSAGYSSKPANPATPPDIKVVTRVSGPEPGYVATPICVVWSAITILTEKEKIPSGVMTPAAAFADTRLIEHLQGHGIDFSILERSDGKRA